MKTYFYYKNKKKVEPVEDIELNKLAKKKLALLLKNDKSKIPSRFLNEWDKVALYHPKGDVEKARSVIMEASEGAYDLTNKLNDLTGKEWVKFTCSWFIFNALHSDLKEEREVSPDTKDHPATYSPTMIEGFIKFFTKEGDTVLDPFCGIGSTLVAAKRTNRIGYGIELNEKYHDLILKRVPDFKGNVFLDSAENIKSMDLPEIDFCISSPPYWDVLNRSTHKFEEKRSAKGLDVNYSDKEADLGNIDDYDEFCDRLADIYRDLYPKMKKGGYVIIIVKNIKKGGVLYPLAWDLARILSKTYVLKDEKIWIQDKVGLAPYGYPYSWTSNILHHYCIVLRKE